MEADYQHQEDETAEEYVSERDLLKSDRANRQLKRKLEIIKLNKWWWGLLKIYFLSLVVLGTYAFLYIERQFDFKGKVEDTCQDLSTLNNINNNIYPLIHELTYKKFFRIFRVNLQNECPFWVSDFICMSKKCSICECNQNDIPQNWLGPQSDAVNQPKVDQTYWYPEESNSVSDWVWHVEDTVNDQGAYIDLKINPEAYTAYQGQHIWAAIYNENCFAGNEWDQMCREERALNKLISGLHTSISTQLSEYYVDFKTNRTYPLPSMYFQKVGNHPDRVKNLFFLYSVLLRAFALAQPAIQNYDINSQIFQEDMESKQLIGGIYDTILSQCSHPFDEKQFFKEIRLVIFQKTLKFLIKETKKSYQKFIHNISMIMDCVECEKCKVFGKMQTYGLGKFQSEFFISGDPDNFTGKLKRNELVALVNTLGKVSSSVHSVQLMYERRYNFWVNLFFIDMVTFGAFLLFLKICLKIYSEMDKKIKKMFKGFEQIPSESKSKNSKAKRD